MTSTDAWKVRGLAPLGTSLFRDPALSFLLGRVITEQNSFLIAQEMFTHLDMVIHYLVEQKGALMRLTNLAFHNRQNREDSRLLFTGDLEDSIMAMVSAQQQAQLKELADSMVAA